MSANVRWNPQVSEAAFLIILSYLKFDCQYSLVGGRGFDPRCQLFAYHKKIRQSRFETSLISKRKICFFLSQLVKARDWLYVLVVWSRSMILAQGARGPVLNSQNKPVSGYKDAWYV